MQKLLSVGDRKKILSLRQIKIHASDFGDLEIICLIEIHVINYVWSQFRTVWLIAVFRQLKSLLCQLN